MGQHSCCGDIEVKNYCGRHTTLLHTNLYRELFGLITAYNDACPHDSVECPDSFTKFPRTPKPAHSQPVQVTVDRVEGFIQNNERYADVSVLSQAFLELLRHKNHIDSAALTLKPALRFITDFVASVTIQPRKEYLANTQPVTEKRKIPLLSPQVAPSAFLLWMKIIRTSFHC